MANKPTPRGPGLDLRTRPEAAASTDPGDSSGVMAQLAAHVRDRLGDNAAPAEDLKKKPSTSPSESGQDGVRAPAGINPATIPIPGAASTPGDSRSHTPAPDSVSGGDGEGEAEGGASSGEREVGEGQEEGAQTDPLKLLNLALPGEGHSEISEKAGAETNPSEPSAGKQTPAKPTPGSALRSQLEKAIAEKRDLEKLIKEIEGRTDPKVKELTLAWESEKKARADAEAKIAQIDYSQSAEFQQRFVEPYNNAFKEAVTQLRGLRTEEGASLSAEEMETIMVGGELEAYRLIDDKFTGPRATLATGIVKDVYSYDRVRNRALEQSRSLAVERRQQNEAQGKARIESLKQLWERERDGRIAKNPDLYGGKDGDTQHSRLLSEGMTLADAAFWRPPNISDEQAVAISAEVRNRAGAFPAMVYLVRAERERVAALEKELAKYKSSGPGRGESGASGLPKQTEYEEGTMEYARDRLSQMLG